MIENRTVLLIDDEAQIRRVLRATLAAQGAKVFDVQNGEEALELLREQTVDLILLDMNMPGLGGLGAGGVLELPPVRGDVVALGLMGTGGHAPQEVAHDPSR